MHKYILKNNKYHVENKSRVTGQKDADLGLGVTEEVTLDLRPK